MRDVVAWKSALLYDMIYTQPVFYEFEKIAVPVLLLIGDKDTTALGKNLAPPAVRATLGNYPVLGKAAAARIPHALRSSFPISDTPRRSRRPGFFTRPCSTACASRRRPPSQTTRGGRAFRPTDLRATFV